MSNRILKVVYPKVIGRSRQLLLNKFFDQSIPSMRNVDDGEKQEKYQPSGAGGTRSPPATPHRLQNPKWPPGGPKMADGVWKWVQP